MICRSELRDVIGIIVAADQQFARPVQAAAAGDAFAVEAEAHAENAPGHGEQLGDQLRVVANLARNLRGRCGKP